MSIAARIQEQIDELAGLSETPPPGVTRVLFSDLDRLARGYIEDLARAVDCTITDDAVGNLFLRWPGSNPDLAPVATGSHIDAIPHSGKYDGVVGVLGGLEAIRHLRAEGFQPERSIEVICFTAEEPTRFGIGCLGSRLMAGSLDETADEQLKDESGKMLGVWRDQLGMSDRSLVSVRRGTDDYAAFVELHIEQGPRLEAEGLDIGLVSHIAGPSTAHVVFEGEGGHAGAVMMAERHDPLVAAGALIQWLSEAARDTTSDYTVATAGRLQNFPNAVNSIPRRVTMELDIRDTDEAVLDALHHDLARRVDGLAGEYGVQGSYERLHFDPPAVCDAALVKHGMDTVNALGLEGRVMISHAYHDSLFMARLCPTTMIFIPCRAGISHRPEEYSSPEQIEKGVRVLAGLLERIARS